MSAQTTPQDIKAAAKTHGCSWCGEHIVQGMPYTRWRCFDGGDAGTVKVHPECRDALFAEAEAEGGWLEFTPGDQERPKPCAF